MQKNAVIVISGARRFDHCWQIFVEMKMLTLFSLCVYIFIYKCITYFRSKVNIISCRSDVHDFNTRFRNNENLPNVG